MKKGTFKEDYAKCIAQGQHNFGITKEQLMTIQGVTSYPCKNCGFLLIWNSNLGKPKEQKI